MAKLIHILTAILLTAGVSLAAAFSPSAIRSADNHGVGSGTLVVAALEFPEIRDATDLFAFLDALGSLEWAADVDGNRRLDHRDVEFFVASFDRSAPTPLRSFESPLPDMVKGTATFASATSSSSERRSKAASSPVCVAVAAPIEDVNQAQIARVDPRDCGSCSSRGPPAA